jgi:hypothetical protein
MIKNLNTVLISLMSERKRMKQLLWAFGATWAIVGFLLKWLIPYAVKGMVGHQ